jgi:hypothetical protein
MTQDQVNDLKASLSGMMDRIEKKEPIIDQLEQIGRIQTEIAGSAPAQLSHFLERRSYAKAIEYLEHGVIVEDPERPECDEEEAHP